MASGKQIRLMMNGCKKPSGWRPCKACGKLIPDFDDVAKEAIPKTCTPWTGSSCRYKANVTHVMPRQGKTPRWHCMRESGQCKEYDNCLGDTGEWFPRCKTGSKYKTGAKNIDLSNTPIMQVLLVDAFKVILKSQKNWQKEIYWFTSKKFQDWAKLTGLNNPEKYSRKAAEIAAHSTRKRKEIYALICDFMRVDLARDKGERNERGNFKNVG